MSDFSSMDNSNYFDNLDAYTSSFNTAQSKYDELKQKAQSATDAFNTALQTPLQTVGTVFIAKGIGRATGVLKKRLVRGIGNRFNPNQRPEQEQEAQEAQEENENNVNDDADPADNQNTEAGEGQENDIDIADNVDGTPDIDGVEAGAEGAEAGAEAGAETGAESALSGLATADVAQGGLDIATDVATLAVGLGVLLGGVFGKKKAQAPPPPKPINPSFQAGVV